MCMQNRVFPQKICRKDHDSNVSQSEISKFVSETAVHSLNAVS